MEINNNNNNNTMSLDDDTFLRELGHIDLSTVDIDADYLAQCAEWLDFATPTAAPHIAVTGDELNLTDDQLWDLMGGYELEAGNNNNNCCGDNNKLQRQPSQDVDEMIRALVDGVAQFAHEHRPSPPASRPATPPVKEVDSEAVPCNNKKHLDSKFPEWMMVMELKELNAFLRTQPHGLSKDEIKHLKEARRRWKSRIYSGRHRELKRNNKAGSKGRASTTPSMSIDDWTADELIM